MKAESLLVVKTFDRARIGSDDSNLRGVVGGGAAEVEERRRNRFFIGYSIADGSETVRHSHSSLYQGYQLLFDYLHSILK